jgi:hypothetical protein
MAIWQINDKGTLVVESSDPQVEVRIAGERVTVVDPLNSRTYEIRIGETPLPSGVYQLELAEANSDLVFSSQTIAIRRGEQTIVKVELRPPGDLAGVKSLPSGGAENSKLEIPTSASFIPPLVPVPKEQIVDKSYDPEVRDRFAEILAKLPALPLDEHFPVDRLSRTATVQKPLSLEGFATWSLEVPPSAQNWIANSDATLFAAASDNVWIVDQGTSPRYVLPVPGSLAGFAFDNRQPNLIAIVSLIDEITEPGDFKPTTTTPYVIHIWRLTDSGAELIHSIPSSSWQIVWDQGYRLIHAKEENFVAFRLDNGTESTLNKQLDNRLIGGRFSDSTSISPQGRFLATRSQSGERSLTNVYDLHRGEFISTIRLSGAVQWRDDDAALAIISNQNDFLEIWKSDQAELLQRVDFHKPEETGSRRMAGNPRLDSNFSRIAQFAPNRDLTIRSLLTGRESSSRMEDLREASNPTLRWNADGTLSILTAENEYVWRQADSEVHGNLRIGRQMAAPPKRKASQRSTGILDAMRGSTLILNYPSSRSATGDRGNFEYSAIKFSELGLIRANRKILSGYQRNSLSPDGESYIAMDSSSTNLPELPEAILNRVYSDKLEKLKPLFPMDPRMANSLSQTPFRFEWSRDGRFLFISGTSFFATRRSPNEPYKRAVFCEVWDARELKKIHFDAEELNQAIENIEPRPNFEAYLDGFLLQLTENDKSHLWHLNPEKNEAVKIQTSDLEFMDSKTRTANDRLVIETELKTLDIKDVRLCEVAGDYVFFRQKDEQDSKISWFRSRIINGKLTEITQMIFGRDDDLIISPNGKYFYRLVYDPSSITVSESRGVKTKNVRNLEMYTATGSIAKWPLEGGDQEIKLMNWTVRHRPLTQFWHPSGQYFLENHSWASAVFILDLNSGNWNNESYYSQNNRDSSVQPTEFGWLLMTSDRLMALSPSGELLATFLFDAEEAESENADQCDTGRWILANGSLLEGQLPTHLHVVSRNDRQVFVQSLQTLSDRHKSQLPQFKQLPFLNSNSE